MRGASSSDGKMHGNRQMVGSYEKSKKPASAPEPEGMGGDESPEEVVAQHGPAQEVHIQHDHEGGKHSVHSKHGGHEHHSEHGSAGEAHEHGKKLAGVQDEQPMEQGAMGKAPAPMAGGYMS